MMPNNTTVCVNIISKGATRFSKLGTWIQYLQSNVTQRPQWLSYQYCDLENISCYAGSHTEWTSTLAWVLIKVVSIIILQHLLKECTCSYTKPTSK